MHNCLFFILNIIISLSCILEANSYTYSAGSFCGNENIQTEEKQIFPPIFVGLGKDCKVAFFLRENQLRTDAYPFDWVLTLDDEKHANLIENDFAHFMDREHMLPNRMFVRNTLYRVDFWHDWPTLEFERFFSEVADKYHRRIKRFYELKNYAGKVFFFRTANNHAQKAQPIEKVGEFIYDSVHSDYPNIDCASATRLKQILDMKFPDLDFTLVILNLVEYSDPREDGISDLSDVLEFKVREKQMGEDFKQITNSLLETAK